MISPIERPPVERGLERLVYRSDAVSPCDGPMDLSAIVSVSVRNNGLNGAGTILNSAATGGSFQFGENNTGGNFRGNFTNTGAGALALTKVGTGTVVLSGQMSGNMGG